MAEKTWVGGTAPRVDDLGDGSHAPLVKLLGTPTVAISGTVPVSAAELPLPAGAAADGTDATGVTNPGMGIRGWLSGIYAKLSGSLAVTGTFWQATQPVSGTVAISGTVPVSAAALPLPTGAATEATLVSVNAKLPTLISSRMPTLSSVPQVTSAAILTLTTNSTAGSTYTAFGSLACSALDIVNNTGTTVEYQRAGAGMAMQIPAGAARMVIGITNANQVGVRRTDVSNTGVTLQAEAFVI